MKTERLNRCIKEVMVYISPLAAIEAQTELDALLKRIEQLSATIKERDETIAAQDKHRAELEAEVSEPAPTDLGNDDDWDATDNADLLHRLTQTANILKHHEEMEDWYVADLLREARNWIEKRVEQLPEASEEAKAREELARITPTRDEAVRLAKASPVPQEWYDEQKQPVPPEITEFLDKAKEDNTDHYWSDSWHRIHDAVRVLAERMVGK